ncbi:hypothetical protein [Ruegeria sp. HKCCD8929]|uniref:hypothetical protein n=1 Tax=Ruegeria sp. HKCCD8929 TaxID=2683006 RepID=UPI001489E1E7|nr:hypothetical protein [Ruegeria sp. HKCCD8929]
MTRVKGAFAEIRPGLIYEAWMADVSTAVCIAAQQIGLTKNPTDYQQFRSACADEFGLPELAACEDRELQSSASKAISEAAADLYGEC